MHLQYRRASSCFAVVSRSSKKRGSGKANRSALLADRNRDFSGLGTNGGHLKRRTRSQTSISRRTANLLAQPKSVLPFASIDMNPPADATAPEPALYDWKDFAPRGELHYIRSEDVANERVARLASRSKSPLIIGLDFEWRPMFISGMPQNPIALVQLACDEEILLVHVSAMQVFPAALRELLESGDSTKVGVGIQYDCKKLWMDHGVSVRNCVDLSLLARSVDKRWTGPYKGGIGLSHLAEIYLKRKVRKGHIQTSNWELELSTRQQEYAANDSHASLAIYRALAQRALNVTPAPPEREYFTFNAIRGILRDDEGRPWFAFNPQYEYDRVPLPQLANDSEGGGNKAQQSNLLGS